MKKKKRQNIELKQVFQESREENPMFMQTKLNFQGLVDCPYRRGLSQVLLGGGSTAPSAVGWLLVHLRVPLVLFLV